HRHGAAGVAVDHRDRATPVALAAHAPVAQAEPDRAPAAALVLEALCQRVEGGIEIHAVVFAGVDQETAFGERALLLHQLQVFTHHGDRRAGVIGIDAAAG